MLAVGLAKSFVASLLLIAHNPNNTTMFARLLTNIAYRDIPSLIILDDNELSKISWLLSGLIVAHDSVSMVRLCNVMHWVR
jgi:hypothetical protein